MIRQEDVEKSWSFLASKEIYLACSGGVDSIVLAHILADFCPKITLLHVNYQLRAEDSENDENLVTQTAQKLNLKFEHKIVNLRKILDERAGNLQEMARKIRFNWFNEYLNNKDSVLVLAHHADDQIETFYQHIARKSGVRGLACMAMQDGNVFRPLLPYSKNEIYAFAQKNSIQWNEDKSNLSIDYTRNKLRNEFLPFLYSKIPKLNQSILLLIEHFQQRLTELETEIKPYYEKILQTNKIDFSELDQLSNDHQHELWRKFGYSAAQNEGIIALKNAQKGKKITSQKYQIIREKLGFTICTIDLEEVNYNLKFEILNELPTEFDKNAIYLDQDLVEGELELKKWNIGDRMAPLGMKGTKLLSDIITEAKIPNGQRKNQLVVKDANTIHWCVGLKIGRLSLANQNTKRILKITLIRI